MTGLTPLGRIALFLLAVLVLAALTGCVHTVVELPNGGGSYRRTAVFTTQSAGEIDVRTGKDTGATIRAMNVKQAEDAAAAFRKMADALLAGKVP